MPDLFWRHKHLSDTTIQLGRVRCRIDRIGRVVLDGLSEDEIDHVIAKMEKVPGFSCDGVDPDEQPELIRVNAQKLMQEAEALYNDALKKRNKAEAMFERADALEEQYASEDEQASEVLRAEREREREAQRLAKAKAKQEAEVKQAAADRAKAKARQDAADKAAAEEQGRKKRGRKPKPKGEPEQAPSAVPEQEPATATGEGSGGGVLDPPPEDLDDGLGVPPLD